jgi:hypothetical protein
MLAEVTHSGDGLLAGRIAADRNNQICNASGSDPDLARPETRICSKLMSRRASAVATGPE